MFQLKFIKEECCAPNAKKKMPLDIAQTANNTCVKLAAKVYTIKELDCVMYLIRRDCFRMASFINLFPN